MASLGSLELRHRASRLTVAGEVRAPRSDIPGEGNWMDLATSLNVDLGSSAWALGVCGVLALFILCATCVLLTVTANNKAPEVLKAFADVIRAFRRRPRQDDSRAVDQDDSAPQLEKAA